MASKAFEVRVSVEVRPVTDRYMGYRWDEPKVVRDMVMSGTLLRDRTVQEAVAAAIADAIGGALIEAETEPEAVVAPLPEGVVLVDLAAVASGEVALP